MIIISSSMGATLVFKDVDDLKTVIEHLQGQLEWVQSNSIKPPYLYHSFEECSEGDIDAYLEHWKNLIGGNP